MEATAGVRSPCPICEERRPSEQARGPGLTNRPIGSTGGGETVTLVPDQMPVHNHLVRCAKGGDGNSSPEGAVWGKARGDAPYTGGRSPVADGSMMPAALGSTGRDQPHNNMQPYLVLSFIIALQGVFPPRG
ncbi:MAG TPA: hypothetical protein VI756_29125 [Blastocatellia bacterium]